MWFDLRAAVGLAQYLSEFGEAESELDQALQALQGGDHNVDLLGVVTSVSPGQPESPHRARTPQHECGAHVLEKLRWWTTTDGE